MLVILILLIFFISIECLLFIYGKKHVEVNCDYIIILGAGLRGDKISSALKRRLDQALHYALKYPDIPIIVSGGQGNDELCSEAVAMKKYLIEQGIKESRIIEENQSVSTYTNFLFTKRVLGGADYRLLVVTCDFHMFRSIHLGKRLGFTCYPYPAKSTNIKCIKYYVREFFCIIKYFITKK